MTDMSDIARAALEAAGDELGANVVDHVDLFDDEGADRDEILRVRLLLRPGMGAKLDGDDLLDALLKISRRVAQAGEERRIVLEYADQEEIDALESDPAGAPA